MAKSTIRGIHATLSGAFEAAMRWEWTDRNPAGSARPLASADFRVPLAASPPTVSRHSL
jgi:hypothetical protein